MSDYGSCFDFFIFNIAEKPSQSIFGDETSFINNFMLFADLNLDFITEYFNFLIF